MFGVLVALVVVGVSLRISKGNGVPFAPVLMGIPSDKVNKGERGEGREGDVRGEGTRKREKGRGGRYFKHARDLDLTASSHVCLSHGHPFSCAYLEEY